ncbi:hypothetical protein [Sciscionella sediminilitoris]|uniref:hypothetical protein n=1 Tax=Sciscionella sediminilitoris TaxID=1445613 RepID=UPI0004DEDFB5|nr:hypothetical protein [Sciscionella sp. SE31]
MSLNRLGRPHALLPAALAIAAVVWLRSRCGPRGPQRSDFDCPVCEPAAHEALQHARGLLRQVRPQQRALTAWRLANVLEAAGLPHVAQHLRASDTEESE